MIVLILAMVIAWFLKLKSQMASIERLEKKALLERD